MRDCNGKMRFYCHLLVVSIVIKAAIAVNATASTVSSAATAEPKSKRQVDQYLRTPGASVSSSLGIDGEQDPQAYPLQLSHNIYNQQRLPLYTRRPTTIAKPQVSDDDLEQAQQPQQQQYSSYYNYVPGVDDIEDDGTGHIDSRHLPVEPRTKVDPVYPPSPPPQRSHAAITYTSVEPRQNTVPQSQSSNDDEYLDLIRNTDIQKNQQQSNSKAQYGYVTTAAPTTAENYPTKSPFNGDYKRYTTRNQPTATPPVPNLQPQTSQQQQHYVRQPAHYVAQPTTHYVTTGQDYSTSYDKDTIRVSLKKYQEPAGKTKYDPARGQYHHEVSAKPTKKVQNFKPSFQYTSTPQVQLSSSSANQQPAIHHAPHPHPIVQLDRHNQQEQQDQPLHYQSVQQIAQTDKSGQQQHSVPQSQYSIVVPQQPHQQAYFSAEPSHPFQQFLPQNERLIASNYGQAAASEQTHVPISQQPQNDGKSNGPSEFRIQYLHHASPTPTPTPRPRYVSDSTPSQPLKYELFEPNGNLNAAKDAPKIKLVAAPQHLHRPQYAEPPQYYKKIKIQPAAHVHYVPVRPNQYQSPQAPQSPAILPSQQQQQQQQYHQQQQQQQQSQQIQSQLPQGQSDVLIPIHPSRTTLFVAPGTGQSDSFSPSVPLNQQIPIGHQTHTDPRKPPLPITSPKKPISQAEFQALVDAGYKVQAIPVPVPVPVPLPSDKYKHAAALQYQPLQRGVVHNVVQPIHNAGPAPHHPAAGQPHTRQAATHYIRYHPKEESGEGILTSYLKPLIDYIGGPNQ